VECAPIKRAPAVSPAMARELAFRHVTMTTGIASIKTAEDVISS
jgi:hypothetical protein